MLLIVMCEKLGEPCVTDNHFRSIFVILRAL